MTAVTIPYTAADTAQIAPVAQRVHGPLRVPSVVPAELNGPLTVRVPGRGAAYYEILIGPPCATDACYRVRVRLFLTPPPDDASERIQEDLPDGGLGFYNLREHSASLLARYPGRGFHSYLIECNDCSFDELNTIARGLRPLSAVY